MSCVHVRVRVRVRVFVCVRVRVRQAFVVFKDLSSAQKALQAEQVCVECVTQAHTHTEIYENFYQHSNKYMHMHAHVVLVRIKT